MLCIHRRQVINVGTKIMSSDRRKRKKVKLGKIGEVNNEHGQRARV